MTEPRWVKRLWVGYLASGGAVAVWSSLFNGPSVLYLIIGFSSVTAVLVAGVVRGAVTGRYVLFASGLLAWVGGDVVWEVLADVPFPNVSDAMYLLGYALLITAVATGIRAEGTDHESSLDALIAVAGAASIVAVPLLRTVAVETSPLAIAVAVCYPIGSLALVGGAARLWLSPRSRRGSTTLLGLGFSAQLVADALYGYAALSGTYAQGPIDLGWLGCYLFVGAAVLHPSHLNPRRARRAEASPLSTARLALLAVSAFAPLMGHLMFGLSKHVAIGLCAALMAMCVGRVAGPMARMRRAVTLDELTGTRTRPALLDAADEVAQLGVPWAYLHVDVDDLSLLNHALGEVTGDNVIKAVANTLVHVVADLGVVGRLAGDEFGVVLPNATVDDAVELAHRVQRHLDHPVMMCDVPVRTTVSAGIVGGSGDASTVVRGAAAGVARAKSIGHSRVVVEASDPQDAYWKVRLASDLRGALTRREISVVFQPEVDTADGGLFGFEVLVRWTHPEIGPVGPGVFIPIAESAGLIDELFEYVLDSALGLQRSWFIRHGAYVPLSVNASPEQLGDGIVDTVRSLMRRWQTPRDVLWIELTESTMGSAAETARALEQLRALGVRLAIDDFGTGHSSLSRLTSSEWDAIKIDKSFIDGLFDDEHCRAVAAATIALAQSLGAITIAEGVETDRQRAELLRLGCDYIQGYLVARPMGRTEADAFAFGGSSTDALALSGKSAV